MPLRLCFSSERGSPRTRSSFSHAPPGPVFVRREIVPELVSRLMSPASPVPTPPPVRGSLDVTQIVGFCAGAGHLEAEHEPPVEIRAGRTVVVVVQDALHDVDALGEDRRIRARRGILHDVEDLDDARGRIVGTEILGHVEAAVRTELKGGREQALAAKKPLLRESDHDCLHPDRVGRGVASTLRSEVMRKGSRRGIRARCEWFHMK